jgi:hypothetical protein
MYLICACVVDSCLFFEMGSHYAAHAGLKLVILLPLPTKSWDYKKGTTLPGSLLILFLQVELIEMWTRGKRAAEVAVYLCTFSETFSNPVCTCFLFS